MCALLASVGRMVVAVRALYLGCEGVSRQFPGGGILLVPLEEREQEVRGLWM